MEEEQCKGREDRRDVREGKGEGEEDGEKEERFSALEGVSRDGISECAVARPTFLIERISLF